MFKPGDKVTFPSFEKALLSDANVRYLTSMRQPIMSVYNIQKTQYIKKFEGQVYTVRSVDLTQDSVIFEETDYCLPIDVPILYNLMPSNYKGTKEGGTLCLK